MVDDAATSRALAPPPPPITSDEPPRGHPSDTVGIFAVLALSGLAHLVAPESNGSLRSLLPQGVAVIYSATLLLFGALGVVATLLPVRLTIPAMGMELAARMALAIATAVYATSVLVTLDLTAGTALVSVVFYGIAVLCAVAAVRIGQWLVRQRRAVSAVLQRMESDR